IRAPDAPARDAHAAAQSRTNGHSDRSMGRAPWRFRAMGNKSPPRPADGAAHFEAESVVTYQLFGASAGAAGAVIGLAELRALWWACRAWCRWCLRCDPLVFIGAFSGAILEAAGAAGAADWSVWARAAKGDKAMAAPRPIAAWRPA